MTVAALRKLNEEVISLEVLEEIEEVLEIECNGVSGQHLM